MVGTTWENRTVHSSYFILYCVYDCFCLHVCMCGTWMRVPSELRRGSQIPWNWSNRWLYTPCVFCMPCLCKSENNLWEDWFSGTGDESEVVRLEWQVHSPFPHPPPPPFRQPAFILSNISSFYFIWLYFGIFITGLLRVRFEYAHWKIS